MSATSKTGELDDFASGLALLPLDDRSASFRAPNEKDIDRHRKDKFSHADLHVSVDDFIIRSIAHPQRKTHTRKLPESTRTVASGADSLTQIKWLMVSVNGHFA
jgi:hypothetical protein